MNLPIPDMGPAERAADLLIPHIEEEWLACAKRGSYTMTVDATVYPDVLPAITRGQREEAWHTEKWVCHPAALLSALRKRLPTGFGVEFSLSMASPSGLGHCYRIQYTGESA